VRKDILNLSNLRLGSFQAKFLGKIALAAVVGVAVCFGILKWQDYSANYWQNFTSARDEHLRALPEIAVGDLAPEFALKTQDGQRTVNFNQVSKVKPVALVFGSYT